MRKYHPGDKVTVRATVKYNCVSGRLLGVEIIGEGNIDHVSAVIPVDQIVSHEKVLLRKGDKVEVKRDHMAGNTYTVIEVYGEYAWIKSEYGSPMTFNIRDLERA